MKHDTEVKKEFSPAEKKRNLHKELKCFKDFLAQNGKPKPLSPWELALLFEETKFFINKWEKYLNLYHDDGDLDIMVDSATIIRDILLKLNEYTLYEGKLKKYRPPNFWQETFAKIPHMVELQPCHEYVSEEHIKNISDKTKEHSKKLKDFLFEHRKDKSKIHNLIKNYGYELKKCLTEYSHHKKELEQNMPMLEYAHNLSMLFDRYYKYKKSPQLTKEIRTEIQTLKQTISLPQQKAELSEKEKIEIYIHILADNTITALDEYDASQKNTLLIEEIRAEIHALKDSIPVFVQRHFSDKKNQADESKDDGSNSDSAAQENTGEEFIDTVTDWLNTLKQNPEKNNYEDWMKSGQQKIKLTKELEEYKKFLEQTKSSARKILQAYNHLTEKEKSHAGPIIGDKIAELKFYLFSNKAIIDEMYKLFNTLSDERFNLLCEKINILKMRFLEFTENDLLPEGMILWMEKEKNTLKLFINAIKKLEIVSMLEKHPLLVGPYKADLEEAKNALIKILSMTTEEEEAKNSIFFIMQEKLQYNHQRARKKGIINDLYSYPENQLWTDREINRKISELYGHIGNILIHPYTCIDVCDADIVGLFRQKIDKLENFFDKDILNLEQVNIIMDELEEIIRNSPSPNILDLSPRDLSLYSSQMFGTSPVEEPAFALQASASVRVANTENEENPSLWNTSSAFWKVECVSDEKLAEPKTPCIKGLKPGASNGNKKHVHWKDEDEEDQQFWSDVSPPKAHFVL